jgi:hypothetical protein
VALLQDMPTHSDAFSHGRFKQNVGNNVKPQDLIRYIVWYATEHDISLTTIRLVKFVYLADLYHARSNNGKTFTGFPWAFVHFGPYCQEVMGAIDQASRDRFVCRSTRESKYADQKDYQLFSCRDAQAGNLEDQLPMEVLSPLRSAIKKYGDDTASLLDHVYFETEPMMGKILKGQLLDFSKLQPVQITKPIKLKTLSKEKISLAREHLNKLSQKMDAAKRRLQRERSKAQELLDDDYFRAVQYMNGEDLEPGLRGQARVAVE